MSIRDLDNNPDARVDPFSREVSPLTAVFGLTAALNLAWVALHIVGFSRVWLTDAFSWIFIDAAMAVASVVLVLVTPLAVFYCNPKSYAKGKLLVKIYSGWFVIPYVMYGAMLAGGSLLVMANDIDMYLSYRNRLTLAAFQEEYGVNSIDAASNYAAASAQWRMTHTWAMFVTSNCLALAVVIAATISKPLLTNTFLQDVESGTYAASINKPASAQPSTKARKRRTGQTEENSVSYHGVSTRD